ncbi:MAG: hypothetical protein IPK19_22825 [Chloroflexi bacterium]|nr:hypothetical protein [Chloroflexota bacterium]
MRRRLLAALVALLPAAALIAWLAITALPLWTAPDPGWLSVDAPGRCAAVGSLRAHAASRIYPSSPQAEAASAAQIALDAAVDGLTVHPAGLAVQAIFERATRPAWLFTASPSELPGAAPANPAQPGFVAVVWIDGQTGEALDVVVGLEDPAARCDLNLRSALRETVLSPPFLLLIGYTGTLMIALLVRAILRRRRRAGAARA